MEKQEQEFTSFDLTFDSAIAELRFSRPKAHNSMNSAFWKEFPEAITKVEKNDKTRVLILSAEGASFSSGMDLSVFQQQDILAVGTAVQRERLQCLIRHLQSVFKRVADCRVPVLAAVQGACIGAGLDLVSACDLRFSTETAYFSIHEINLAMMADLGSLQRLPQLMPQGVLFELALSGDKLKASRARELGLVNEVFADEEKLRSHVRTLAEKIAARSPLAVQATRQALKFARSHSVDESLEMAAVLQSAIFDPAQVMAAVAAQKSGKAAQFDDLDRSELRI